MLSHLRSMTPSTGAGTSFAAKTGSLGENGPRVTGRLGTSLLPMGLVILSRSGKVKVKVTLDPSQAATFFLWRGPGRSLVHLNLTLHQFNSQSRKARKPMGHRSFLPSSLVRRSAQGGSPSLSSSVCSS